MNRCIYCTEDSPCNICLKNKFHYQSLADGHKIDVTEVEEMYEPNRYKLGKAEPRKTVEEGTKIKDEVVEVKEGTRRGFISNWEAYIKNNPNVDPEEACIEVRCASGARKIIALPKTDDAHPKSVMGKWLKTYKKAPSPGQAVECVADEKGYFRVVLYE